MSTVNTSLQQTFCCCLSSNCWHLLARKWPANVQVLISVYPESNIRWHPGCQYCEMLKMLSLKTTEKLNVSCSLIIIIQITVNKEVMCPNYYITHHCQQGSYVAWLSSKMSLFVKKVMFCVHTVRHYFMYYKEVICPNHFIGHCY